MACNLTAAGRSKIHTRTVRCHGALHGAGLQELTGAAQVSNNMCSNCSKSSEQQLQHGHPHMQYTETSSVFCVLYLVTYKAQPGELLGQYTTSEQLKTRFIRHPASYIASHGQYPYQIMPPPDHDTNQSSTRPATCPLFGHSRSSPVGTPGEF